MSFRSFCAKVVSMTSGDGFIVASMYFKTTFVCWFTGQFSLVITEQSITLKFFLRETMSFVAVCFSCCPANCDAMCKYIVDGRMWALTVDEEQMYLSVSLGMCRDSKAACVQAGQGDRECQAGTTGAGRPGATVCLDEWLLTGSQQVRHTQPRPFFNHH